MANEENLQPYKSGKDWQGNKDGRPIGSKNRSTIARKWLEVELEEKNPLTGELEKLSQEDYITLAQIKLARSCDTQAYKALQDSAYGAPKQELDATVTGQINLNIQQEDANLGE